MRIFRIAFALLLASLACSGWAQVRGVKHVVIVGCDGMSPNGVMNSSTPNMRRMIQDGAFSMHARGVMPTSSSPNWASMIMGAGPEQHGVTSNDWQPSKYEIPPAVVGDGGIFPTIFGLIRAKRSDAIMGVFHDWSDYGRLFEREAVNKIEDSDGPTNAMLHAIEFLQTEKPLFTFIHLDHVDHAGHEFGHGTQEYFASVKVADELIGTLLKSLESAGMMDRTIVLITADHGGKDKGHGGATMAEIEIPWILYGKGVRHGHELKTAIDTFDTAVTVAHILGIKPHPAWIGKPITEAFR